MNILPANLLKDPIFSQNRKVQQIILVQQNFSLLFERDGHFKIICTEKLLKESNSKQKKLVLLSAPFAYSYLHTTIPLTSKEQLQANDEKLGFSRFSSEGHQVHSFRVDDERWVTIYTHVSPKGQKLLEKLKKKRIKIAWKPTVVFLVNRFLSITPTLINEGTSVLLVLDQEVIKCSRTQTSLHFQHLFAWDKTRRMEEHLPMMENLWEVKPEASTTTTLHFNEHVSYTDSHLSFLNRLFFSSNLQSVPITFSRKTKSRSGIIRAFSPIRLATLCLIGTLVWSGVSYTDLQNLKEKRTRLKQEIRTLEAVSMRFKSLAKSERSLIKMDAVKSTVKKLQLKPTLLLVKIDTLLQGNSWIKSIDISNQSIRLELLDHYDDNASGLIERLTTSLGTVNLEESSTELYNDKTLKKYTLFIKREDDHAPAKQLAQK